MSVRLKLYHCPATRSARVKWLLHELLDEDFEVEVVSLYDNEQYEPEHLARNPNHALPVLEITTEAGETLHMIESGAMIALLADTYPERGLAPPPRELSRERIDYLQMLHFGSTWMDMMLWQVRVHEHLLPARERDPGTIARYRSKLAGEVEPQLLARLEKTPYICGDAFSAADCVIAHNVLWARAYALCRDKRFSAYLSRVSKRPAFVKAFADAHQFTPELPAGKALSGFTG